MTKSLTNLTPSGVEREEAANRIVNAIMDDFGRAGGLHSILESANYASRIRSTIWLHVHAALALPSEPPSQGDGWCFDMKSAPANCLIFDPVHGVSEGLRFDGGNWGVATFNGSILGVSPVAWRPKPEAPALNQGADDGR